MHSVHIPNNQDKIVIPTCGDLSLSFAEHGELSWTGPRREFNPHLPDRRVDAGEVGPFVAPNHDVEVQWTFIAHGSGMKTSGTIEVIRQQKSGDRRVPVSAVEQER